MRSVAGCGCDGSGVADGCVYGNLDNGLLEVRRLWKMRVSLGGGFLGGSVASGWYGRLFFNFRTSRRLSLVVTDFLDISSSLLALTPTPSGSDPCSCTYGFHIPIHTHHGSSLIHISLSLLIFSFSLFSFSLFFIVPYFSFFIII